MSIELRPLGITCNIACLYCYQNMHRDAGNGHSGYDLKLIKDRLTVIGESFHLFGGEPLLMPINDLQDLLEWEFKRHGVTTVVTNGVLINDAHINLFKNYNTSVGISIDGPEELNDIRWAGTLKNTRKATASSIFNIDRLLNNNIRPGFQIQVTKCNSSLERLPKMLDWISDLDSKGIVSMRLHILEIDNPIVREQYAFTNEENVKVFNAYSEFEKTLKNIRFDIFNDMKLMLSGNDNNATCTWRACDPYTTEAVKGMDGEGRMSNCGLTDKEGINFQKPEIAGYERYIALYHTPQEHGGCNGCRFFLACKGQCPGTAINSDWRNKSENCGVWMHFFEKLESDLTKKGATPLSLHPNREELEKEMLAQWSLNNNPTVESLLTTLTNNE
jgi:uncharacterized protein